MLKYHLSIKKRRIERTSKMEVFKKVLIGIYIAVCVILILVTTFTTKDSQTE